MLLLGVGSCFDAFLLTPVVAALRARGVPFRIAAGAPAAELVSLRAQLGADAAVQQVENDDDDAKRYADELLAAPTDQVAYLGTLPFPRQLAQQAALRQVPVVRLDAGVRAFGRPLPSPPWADAWFVAGDLERNTVLESGAAAHAVHVVGDLVADAVAGLAVAAGEPHGLAPAFEHGAAARDRWLQRPLPAHLVLLREPAAGADVATWIAHAAKAQVVLTDSVGWQRIAVALGVPCAVVPTAGLWAPGVAAGLVTQMGATPAAMDSTLLRAAALPKQKALAATGAGARIADLLQNQKRAAIALPSDGDASGRTFGNDEAALVEMVLQRGTLNSTRGTFVTAFEQRFAKWIGRKHAIACASGSAAVHCAIAALQLQAGDEVITTPITDMGALTPILYEGAVPVFADVDPHTLNVTAATLAAQLTPRTRAIVVTHLFGLPCDMAPIVALATARGIAIVEDSAQAFGATLDGRKAGTFGAIGTYSLQQGKHITTGEGGIVATDDDALARRLFLYVNKAWGYGDAKPDHYFPALNYRLTELQGAVACAQLPKLDQVVAARRDVAAALREALADVRGLRLPQDPAGGTHSYWKFAFQVDPTVVAGGALALGKRMQQAGISCVPRYIQKPAFDCELFRDWSRSPVTSLPLQSSARAGQAMPLFARGDYPGTLAALEHVIVLPINERYLPHHVSHVAEAIRTAVRELQHG